MIHGLTGQDWFTVVVQEGSGFEGLMIRPGIQGWFLVKVLSWWQSGGFKSMVSSLYGKPLICLARTKV